MVESLGMVGHYRPSPLVFAGVFCWGIFAGFLRSGEPGPGEQKQQERADEGKRKSGSSARVTGSFEEVVTAQLR